MGQEQKMIPGRSCPPCGDNQHRKLAFAVSPRVPTYPYTNHPFNIFFVSQTFLGVPWINHHWIRWKPFNLFSSFNMADRQINRHGSFYNIEFLCCWLHHYWKCGCAADAVPPVTSKLVLILQTSEGWQAESTHQFLFQGRTGAQTQHHGILRQPR